MEVKAFREKGFRGLAVLSFFGETGSSTDVVGLLRGGIRLSCAWLTSSFSPKNVKSSLTKLKDALFNNCGFLFEILLSGRKKEGELSVSEDFGPCIDVVR